jgi:hypothetical protein
MKATTPSADRPGSGSISGMMATPVVVAFATLLIALLGGFAWGAREHSDLGQALRASEVRDDLREAHNALLGAHVNLYEHDYHSASRQLEDARGRLRRAAERGTRLGWQDDVRRLDLARFEADIDEAQRLLGQLDQEANSRVPRGQGIVEGVPRGSAFLLR